jgi:hypothetical protein
MAMNAFFLIRSMGRFLGSMEYIIFREDTILEHYSTLFQSTWFVCEVLV